jgi:hexosaminidase
MYTVLKKKHLISSKEFLDEVMELFPSRYIHIGGDECPKTRWKSCEHCQQLIQEKDLQDEHGLQSYFIQRIEKYLNTHNRQIIGWDEILEGGLAPNATVMSWRGTQGGIEAAKSGHGVVMTPTSHCYFDYYQSDNPDEPLAIGGYLPLEKVYNFEPVPPTLSTEEQAFILGAQGNVWTEYMPNSDKVEYMVLPRMQAMAEIGWTQPAHKDLTRFINKLDDHFTWWKAADYEYADKTLEIKTAYHQINYTTGLTLETMHPEGEIYYTIGDQEKLILFQKGDTIKINSSTRITARASKPGYRVGARKVIESQYHRGMKANASLLHGPSPVYSGHGVVSLFNGINGSSEKYGDNEWLGFSGQDLEVNLQFENPMALSDFQTRFFHGPGQWIHAPKKVEIFSKQGNGLYSLIASAEVKAGSQKVTPIRINFPETMVTELKILVHRYGLIPEGQAGAGHEAWLFVDELRLN